MDRCSQRLRIIIIGSSDKNKADIKMCYIYTTFHKTVVLYNTNLSFVYGISGGSILSTRCSETYETKTALMSLFGLPLWYFSQSPRVVIQVSARRALRGNNIEWLNVGSFKVCVFSFSQPDVYPGNCWAFKGSQGYLVIRLSMRILPTSFCVEHIPKTLSPAGNITSAPRNFTVYVSKMETNTNSFKQTN